MSFFDKIEDVTIVDMFKIARRQKWARIGIFKPAEPHNPWDACSPLVCCSQENGRIC